jgi:murein L,D-transpeptidase YcbB/YkuD
MEREKKMKKYLLVLVVIAFGVCMFGCGKKQAVEELQEPMTLETMSTVGTAIPTTPEAKVQVAPVAPTTAAKMEPLPPAGPYKPTAKEIQTALKNAGFYAGEIDGKIGPKSKKAIEDFQTANNLKADGKVGPQTWAVLSKFLAAAPAAPGKR